MKALLKSFLGAIRSDDASAVNQFLDGNPGLAKEKLPVDGDTPLHLAVRRMPSDGEKIRPVISVLLEHGADWDAPNQMGETPGELLTQLKAVPAIS